ncbi:type II toxin-antitoxin system RatA family toxin [Temperatibacter marinus]|uniref:Type II toxin-antitoxin system RatA family toxin n=1 Tax=Temperatibacter marinus TaxID=1456591 RepID=A0AA52HA41_9PROT|nr:type II toxin-antitoxin system RatA family toxin [Temperatibacter marinus]WND02330.1 type II toxin-antitoxin system RatA family toxin [Temperatibacter marinus]
MPKLTMKKDLPYSVEQMFDLVSDVNSYDQFLPWCQKVRVYAQKQGQFDADLIIGFKNFRETFTSRVTYTAPKSVNVDYIKGPLKRLYNHWQFSENAGGGCHVDFEVDLEFKSRILENLIGTVFTEASKKMIDAFESRAEELYGLR